MDRAQPDGAADELIAALEARDPTRTRAAMQAHIAAAEQILLRHLDGIGFWDGRAAADAGQRDRRVTSSSVDSLSELLRRWSKQATPPAERPAVGRSTSAGIPLARFYGDDAPGVFPFTRGIDATGT